MSLTHVYPEGSKHKIDHGGDCWCEPRILDFGLDSNGKPAKVFIHEGIKEAEVV